MQKINNICSSISEENNGEWIITKLPMSQSKDFKVKTTTTTTKIERIQWYKVVLTKYTVKSKWIMTEWAISKC